MPMQNPVRVQQNLTYDEDGFANVTIAATCEDSDDDVVAVLQDNSKDENGQCTHIETEIKQEAGSCETERKIETVCVSCGESLGVIDTLEKGEHTWNEGEITTPATCAETGIKTFTCTACNETKTDTIAKDTNHKNIITVSGTPASCTQAGLTEGKICETCNTIIEEQKTINKLDHSYTVLKDTVPSTCIELGHKVMKCENCEATTNVDLTEYGAHTWNAGEITTPANCVDTGVKTFTCSICNDTKTESVAVDANNHKSIVTDTAVDSSCTHTGLTEGSHCEACNKVIVAQTETEKKPHDYTEVITKPTCTEGGFTTRTCGDCGHVEKVNETPVIDHTPSDWIVEKAATVDAEGLEIKKCTVCGAKLEERAIPKLTPSYMLGDINGDKKVTASDARIALRISARLEKLEDQKVPVLAVADVNGDGKVTAKDARTILRVAARLESF